VSKIHFRTLPTSEKAKHHRVATLALSDASLPAGKWTPKWDDPECRWEIIKTGYSIGMLGKKHKRYKKELPAIPIFIRVGMIRSNKRLKALERCRVCGILKEFCTLAYTSN
jgi:hypothetical protein